MRTIIIGRKGEQPFDITADGVSSEHARLEIGSDGVWTLEDLDSTNGTFIRNENFVFERIVKRRIDKDTIIRLGDETINGMTFTALQLVKEDPNDYSYEFKMLRKEWNDLCNEKAKLEKRMMYLSWLPMLLSVLCLLATMSSYFKHKEPSDQMLMMRLLMLLPSFFSPIINNQGKKMAKRLSSKTVNTIVCPKCRRILTEQEVIKAQCAVCKAHG